MPARSQYVLLILQSMSNSRIIALNTIEKLSPLMKKKNKVNNEFGRINWNANVGNKKKVSLKSLIKTEVKIRGS